MCLSFLREQETLNSINRNSVTFSEEEKLQLLGIEDEIEAIKKLRFEKVNIDYQDVQGEFQIIDLNKLIGINNRGDDSNNWIELLFDLHKNQNFIEFTRGNFINYISLLCESQEELPIVIEDIKGNYFIDGNGKHRLTIAKCMSVEKFPVIVKKK